MQPTDPASTPAIHVLFLKVPDHFSIQTETFPHFLGHLSTSNSLNIFMCTHRYMQTLEEPTHTMSQNLIVKSLIRKLNENQNPTIVN